jgi:hypothetical protein
LLLEKCHIIRRAIPGATSIDSLISAHSTDDHISFIARLAIAKSILNAERRSTLYLHGLDNSRSIFERVSGSYLIPLFQKLAEGVDREDVYRFKMHLSFYVFNYDRCLEYFFSHALAEYFYIELEEAQDLVQSAVILHPYGSLGSLLAKKGSDEAGITFGAHVEDLSIIATNLKTFSENRYVYMRDNLNFSILYKMSQVIFLGFVYHKQNMDMLAPGPENYIGEVLGTAYGLSGPEMISVQESIKRSFNKSEDPCIIDVESLAIRLDPTNCATFLRENFHSIGD